MDQVRKKKKSVLFRYFELEGTSFRRTYTSHGVIIMVLQQFVDSSSSSSCSGCRVTTLYHRDEIIIDTQLPFLVTSYIRMNFYFLMHRYLLGGTKNLLKYFNVIRIE